MLRYFALRAAGAHERSCARALPAIGDDALGPYLTRRDGGPHGKAKMLTKTKILLSAAIVFGTVCSASAAAKHHTASRGRPEVHERIYDTVPNINTDACLPTDNPCRTRPDGW